MEDCFSHEKLFRNGKKHIVITPMNSHVQRGTLILLLLYTLHNILQFPTLQYYSSIQPKVARRIPKLKKNSNPIFSFYCTPIVDDCFSHEKLFRNGKKHIDNRSRYDYTLHAIQDDKHHDNARTN